MGARVFFPGHITRRDFVGAALLLAARHGSAAAAPLRIGLVLSPAASSASIERGAEQGLAEAQIFAGLLGKSIELVKRQVASSREAFDAGLKLFREERVCALVGGSDEVAAHALARAAERATGLFVNVGAASSRLRDEHCGGRSLHVAPGVDAQVEAAGLWLAEDQGRTRWAVVAGEHPFGEDVARAVQRRSASVRAQIVVTAAPPPGGNWDGLWRRLEEARPDAVWLGLLPEQLSGFQHETLPAGAELVGVAPDAWGPGAGAWGVWPLAWHASLRRFSAAELNRRFRARFGQAQDGAAWAAWAGTKLLAEAGVRSGQADPTALLAFVAKKLAFDGHKGAPLLFSPVHRQLRQPLYLVRYEDGSVRDKVAAEIGLDRLATHEGSVCGGKA